MRPDRAGIVLATALALLAPVGRSFAAPGPVPCVPAGPLGDRCERLVATYDAGDSDAARDLASSPDGATVYTVGIIYDAQHKWHSRTVAQDAGTGAVRWAADHAAPGGSEPRAIAVSTDGSRVFVAGNIFGPSGSFDYGTIAYDASTGAELWVSLYNHETFGLAMDKAYDVAVSPDGALVLVTGQSFDRDSDFDIATVAYRAADGTLEWAARHTGEGDFPDMGWAAAVDPDGLTAYVTGQHGAPGGTEEVTIAYETEDGDVRWVARRAPGGTFAAGYDLAMAPEGGRVFVTGESDRPGTFADYLTIAIDAGTGEELWAAHHAGNGDPAVAGLADDYASALELSRDGASVYVTGSSYSMGTLRVAAASSYDMVTVAYDAATGLPKWTSAYDGPRSGYDQGTDLAVGPNGRVYAAGSSASAGPGLDIAIVALDPGSGDRTWFARYDHWTKNDTPAGLVASTSGVFLAGTVTDDQGDTDFGTLAYDP